MTFPSSRTSCIRKENLVPASAALLMGLSRVGALSRCPEEGEDSYGFTDCHRKWSR